MKKRSKSFPDFDRFSCFRHKSAENVSADPRKSPPSHKTTEYVSASPRKGPPSHKTGRNVSAGPRKGLPSHKTTENVSAGLRGVTNQAVQLSPALAPLPLRTQRSCSYPRSHGEEGRYPEPPAPCGREITACTAFGKVPRPGDNCLYNLRKNPQASEEWLSDGGNGQKDLGKNRGRNCGRIEGAETEFSGKKIIFVAGE